MIIQKTDDKIVVVSMSNELLPIHETLGYELMDAPEGVELKNNKLKLVDGKIAVDTEAMEAIAAKKLTNEVCCAVKDRLDDVSKEFGFRGIDNAMTYVSFENDFKDIAEALSRWAADCWVIREDMTTDSVQDVLDALPELEIEA